MGRRGAGGITAAVVVAAAMMLPSSPASAHETRVVGETRFTIGWADEPAVAGESNAVALAVADLAGAPVTDPAASLTVEISFGDERLVRPLVAGAAAGTFAAKVVPTRAGTYAFRLTGTVRGVTVDITSTCSDNTFDCVSDVGEIQFPAREPSAAQLGARLDREVARADRGRADASTARGLALGAVAVALGALALAGVALRRGGRRG